MRIGIDARPLAHPYSGIGRYTQQIIRNLSECRDWSLVLFSPDALAEQWHDFEIKKYAIVGLPDVAVFQFGLSQLCRESGIDVFFGPRHQLPLFLKCPSVLTIHDMAWRNARKTMKRSGAMAETILAPSAIKRATRIITVSHNTRTEVINFDPRTKPRLSTIYEGPCVPVKATHVEMPQPFILAVGTQEPRKNYERLLGAFRKISSTLPELRLVIVGGRGWKTDLTGTIKQLDLSHQVSILENLDDDKLADLYATCTLLAMPSLYEGFGLPLVEAMHYGKPILTSDHSSMREIASDAAVFVDPLDENSIAQGLLSITSDPDLRARLAIESQNRSSLFSWKTAAQRTAEVFEEAHNTVL